MHFKEVSLGITYPYGIISDVHCHPWSAYSYTNSNGINNRLQHILDGIEQAANAILDAGGKDLIITGDLFHTRGVIKPSVFNPTLDLFRKLIAKGIRVYTFDGNHDMEQKHVATVGSSLYGLAALEGFTVFYEPTVVDGKFLFIPWEDEPAEVQNLITKGSNLFSNLTLFCHVGLSGVLPGNMGHVVNVDDLLELDFKYVFSGHFHNHVGFDARVFSVGALTHQTWGDVGSLAGYVIVAEDEVKHFPTNAPRFIDFNRESKHVCAGNYIRIKDVELTEEEAAKKIAGMKKKGALAVLDQSNRPTIKEKDLLKAVKVDLGLNTALETYCKHTYGDNWEKVFNACLKLKN